MGADGRRAPGHTLMPDPCVLTIRVVPGTPRTGLWCESCLLPSRVELDLWWLRADGLRLIAIATACINEHDHEQA